MTRRFVLLLFCPGVLIGCGTGSRPDAPRQVKTAPTGDSEKGNLARQVAQESTWGPTEVRATLAAGLVGTASEPLALAGFAGSLQTLARRSAEPLDDRQARALLAASLVGKADVYPLVALAWAELLDPAYEVYRTAPVRRKRTFVSRRHRRSTILVSTFWHSPSSTRSIAKPPMKPRPPRINPAKMSRPVRRR